MSEMPAAPSARIRPRTVVWLCVFLALAAFAAANVHLVYVAVETQPDCVEHRQGPDGSPVPYRAAKPSC